MAPLLIIFRVAQGRAWDTQTSATLQHSMDMQFATVHVTSIDESEVSLGIPSTDGFPRSPTIFDSEEAKKWAGAYIEELKAARAADPGKFMPWSESDAIIWMKDFK